MFSLKKSKGFTIVELLIVIVVIGILATLVIVTFSGIQQKARNTARQTDINAVQSHVEAYYASTGTYPALSMINDAAFRTANMKGLDPEALKDPKGSASTLASTATATEYGYAPLAAGVGCNVTGTGAAAISDCDSYTLTAVMEGGGSDYVKKSN